MRLLEAILDANRRRIAGDAAAAVPVAELGGSLPIAALTCIDARLNRLVPEYLGIPEEHFIWLRNAGNIITGPLSSTMRSLSLACAVKGAREIVVLGHTDCLVGKTTMLQLLDRLGGMGVDRHRLPENLVEYFGLFSSERQNVTRGVELVRSSPLIGTKVPVHGLMIDIKTGKVECAINGYDAPPSALPGKAADFFAHADDKLEKLSALTAAAEELKMPTAKIGEIVSVAHDWLHKAEHVAATATRMHAAVKPPPLKKP